MRSQAAQGVARLLSQAGWCPEMTWTPPTELLPCCVCTYVCVCVCVICVCCICVCLCRYNSTAHAAQLMQIAAALPQLNEVRRGAAVCSSNRSSSSMVVAVNEALLLHNSLRTVTVLAVLASVQGLMLCALCTCACLLPAACLPPA